MFSVEAHKALKSDRKEAIAGSDSSATSEELPASHRTKHRETLGISHDRPQWMKVTSYFGCRPGESQKEWSSLTNGSTGFRSNNRDRAADLASLDPKHVDPTQNSICAGSSSAPKNQPHAKNPNTIEGTGVVAFHPLVSFNPGGDTQRFKSRHQGSHVSHPIGSCSNAETRHNPCLFEHVARLLLQLHLSHHRPMLRPPPNPFRSPLYRSVHRFATDRWIGGSRVRRCAWISAETTGRRA